MAKIICKCGERLWNGQTPNEIELIVYTDKEWSNILEKDVLNSWEIPEPKYEVWRCPRCERLYVYDE